MRGTSLALVLVAASFLAGCQTTYYDAGNTPITVSQRAAAAFERYKTSGSYPLFFAISTDGQSYGFNTCPATMCTSGSEYRAIDLCEKGGKKCKIFAAHGNVVWQAPVKWPGYQENEYPLVLLKKNGPSTTNYNGTATFVPAKNHYKLAVRYGGGTCAGVADPAKGRWNLDCGSKTAAGTLVSGSRNKFDGVGKEGNNQLGLEILERPETAQSAQITASGVKPAEMNAKDLCRTALSEKESRLAWDRRDVVKAHVDKAKRRGFSVNACRDKADLAPLERLTATRIKRFNLVTTSGGGEQNRSGFAVEVDGGNRFALSVNITDKGGIRPCNGEVDLFRMVWKLECPGFGNMSGSVARGGGALYSGADPDFEKGPVQFIIEDRPGAGKTS